jgi:hypothetical protein
VAELFCERVIPHHVEVTISHSRLLALLAQQQQQPASAHQMNGNNHIAAAPLRPGDGSSKVMSAGNTKSTRRELTGEELVSTLLQLGLLARHLVDDSAYLFACPGGKWVPWRVWELMWQVMGAGWEQDWHQASHPHS